MKQKKQQGQAEFKKTRRRAGSIIWKLTARHMLRMFFMLLAINLLVLTLCIGIAVINMERTALRFYSLTVEGQTDVDNRLFPEIYIEISQSAQRGVKLNGYLEQQLEMPQGTYRWLEWPDWGGISSLWDQAEPVYIVQLPSDSGEYLTISFHLADAYRQLRAALVTVLCIEGVLLIFAVFGVSASVRKTLAPIQQLTAAARSFSVEKSTPHNPKSERQELVLSGTIDTLNTITAKRLDTRILIDGEQQELRGLAGAINNMLDRLDAAYQSQLRFVSDASHELRTPISVIQGYANLLDRWGKEDPATLQESINAIKAETESMQALVEQLLFLARSDNNSIVLDFQRLDLSSLIGEVIKAEQIMARDHPIVFEVPPGLFVVGDAGLLKQALRIFLDNAVKYSPSGEPVKVTAWTDEAWVKVTVADQGIGIPGKDLPHVFERFYRSDESRARKTGGTGLGLAIAKWTVQRHGGHMDILSRQNIGTRLTMALPAAKPVEVSLAKAQGL